MLSSVITRQQKRALERAARKAARRRGFGPGALAVGTLLAASAAPAVAATITVNSNADILANADGCTIREAIQNANDNAQTNTDCAAGSGADTIVFSLSNPSTITLDSSLGPLPITDDLTLNGPGIAALTISGNNATHIFQAGGGSSLISVDINHLTLTAGYNTSSGYGGAIASSSANLTLDSLVIGNSFAYVGGALSFEGYYGGALTVTNCTISGNGAFIGGGVSIYYAYSTVDLANDTFSGNLAGIVGGGIAANLADGAALTIRNSVITGNTAGELTGTPGYGGGLSAGGSGTVTVTIADSIITGNVADAADSATVTGATTNDVGYGGGLALGYVNATIRGTTISGNTAYYGGGVYAYLGNLTMENTTIVGNHAASTVAPAGSAVGGGVALSTNTATINETTITNNDAAGDGGGIQADATSSITLGNSIVANNTSAAAISTPDINSAGTVTANYTLIKTPTGPISGGTGNLPSGTDPQLGALATNHSTVLAGAPGSTQTPQTELPACGSPVINTGDPAFAPPPAVDQRNLPRVSAARIDMGSVEFQASTIQLTSNAASVSETAGTVTVTASRAGGSDGQVSASFATANGTAAAGADYTTTAGTLTWPDGDTANKTFNVPILDDAIFEGSETFTATLSSPTCNSTLGTAAQAVTIVDNEAQPTITIGSVSQAEGNSGTTNFVFLVTLSNASAQTVTVNFSTVDGSAIAGSDYTATSGTLTFAPGIVTQSITVPVVGDTLNEANEAFSVNLSGPVNATIGGGTGSGTIINDDSAPALSVNSPAQPEGNSGATPMTFTVTLAPASGQTVTVNYATADGTANAGSDYTTASGTLTFAPGTTTQSVSVPVVGDTVLEPDETFTLNLSGATNAAIATATGTATIQNDDAGTADLSIAMTTSGGTFFATQPITYTITVSNAGPNAATSLTVTDVVPAGATFVSATPSQGTCSGTSTITCNLGTLANAATATVTLQLTPSAAGPLTNTATVSSAQTDPTAANNTAASTVTVTAASGIPVLGDLAKILLALTVALFGMFKIRKE